MMNGCKIETYSVKPSEPRTKYKEWFYLYPEDNSNDQAVTWRGHFGGYIYTVIQKYHPHRSKNRTSTLKKSPSFKEDPDTHYAFISSEELADALNKHLDRIYG